MRWSDYIANTSSAALSDGVRTLSYQKLLQAIAERVDWLTALGPQAVALELNNGIEWVLFDMACAQAAIPCIPIPPFFSEQQRRHTVTSAGVALLLTDSLSYQAAPSPFAGVACVQVQTEVVGRPAGTAKVTFTSGSTGEPKGVCLSVGQQLATARSILQAIGLEHPVHLAILPLATLLENIAGVYAPLLAGGTVFVPDNDRLGFVGSRLQAPGKLLQAITQFQPDTLILVPELLLFLVNAVAQGWRPPHSLQFIAVGGAKVSPNLLSKAAECGLPVYQGYGLSECGSVVALNTPLQQREGSIGKALPHVQTAVRGQELVVTGNTFLGYLNEPDSWYPRQVATGDLVHQDAQGYLWFDGRERNQIVSSFGRNISPEWPESELLSDGFLRQAVVFGDARPHCIALITPFVAKGGQQRVDIPHVQAWLQRINQRLPDYAQLKQCLVLAQPLTTAFGLFTDNGRPNRDAIADYFAADIEALYQQPQVCVRAATVHAPLVGTSNVHSNEQSLSIPMEI